MVGIHAFGGYVPRPRLQLASAYAGTGWFAPGLRSLAKGERSFCAWDEDSVTMAVEAARDCLGTRDRSTIARVLFASTDHVYAERQNSTIVKEALNLSDDTAALDLCGSQRVATSALIDAFHSVEGNGGDTLCIAAGKSTRKPASTAEFSSGHGAAAVLLSKGDGCAKLIGTHSVSIDFVDHFRQTGEPFGYDWEARWVRDEGYGKIVASTVSDALAKLDLAPEDIDRFVLAVPVAKAGEMVAQKTGIQAKAVVANLAGTLGDAGAAQPLILLSHLLETAQAGQTIVLVGFGSGCDVIVLETTATIAAARPISGIRGFLEDREPIDNYVKYLAISGLLELDAGMRAELDQKPILTAQYRERKAVLALVGGKCSVTGTVQFPRTPISVAQNARTTYTQEDYPLAERPASIITFTADHLQFTPTPPAHYGNIEFAGGGRMMAEIVNVGDTSLEVGMPLRMVFRIKSIDQRRGYTQYFWKAALDRRPAIRGPQEG